MRWSQPTVGEAKGRTRFALLPVELTTGDIIWLEWYFERSSYVERGRWVYMGSGRKLVPGWVVQERVSSSR